MVLFLQDIYKILANLARIIKILQAKFQSCKNLTSCSENGPFCARLLQSLALRKKSNLYIFNTVAHMLYIWFAICVIYVGKFTYEAHVNMVFEIVYICNTQTLQIQYICTIHVGKDKCMFCYTFSHDDICNKVIIHLMCIYCTLVVNKVILMNMCMGEILEKHFLYNRVNSQN